MRGRFSLLDSSIARVTRPLAHLVDCRGAGRSARMTGSGRVSSNGSGSLVPDGG